MAPVHLLVLSTHLISSTLVCLVEVMYAKDVPQATINKNLPGYVSFLVVGMFHNVPLVSQFINWRRFCDVVRHVWTSKTCYKQQSKDCLIN
jgi:hypothetical protein